MTRPFVQAVPRELELSIPAASRSRWAVLGYIVCFAAVYVASARLGLALGALNGLATPVWPATGISVATMMVLGKRLWPGVALGAFLANFSAGAPPGVAFGITVGNTLEALVAAELLGRARVHGALDRLRDVVAFLILGGALATAISATVGVSSGWMGGVIPSANYLAAWITWWLGDAMGLLLFGAPLLIVSAGRAEMMRAGEAVTLLCLLTAASILIFGFGVRLEIQPQLFAYVVFPFVVWAALRTGPFGVAVTMLLVSIIAIAATALGLSPFSEGTLHQSLLMLQSFMGIIGVTGLVLAAVISERERARVELSETERELSDFVENAVVGLHWVGPDGRIQWANRAEMEMLGYTADEYIGHPIADFHAEPKTAEEILERLRRCEAVDHFETRMRCKDGSIRHVLVSSNVFWHEGQFVHTRCFTRDITARRLAEEALQESEGRLRAMFDQVIVGISQSDLSGRFILVNDRYCEIVGRSREELLTLRMQDITHPEDLPRNIELFKELKSRGTSFVIEKRYVRPDGSHVWVSNSVSAITDRRGRPQYGVAVTLDIGDRKQAERELRESDRRKDLFLAMLGHELRNLLGPVRTSSEILKRSGSGDPSGQRARDIIERQVAHMARLMDDLLDVSRIARGTMKLRLEPLDLALAVHRVIEDHRNHMEGRGLSLVLQLPATPLWVQGDATRLSQVIGNLLHNAAKFTPPGGRVTVRAVALPSGAVRLTVSDTGLGADPEPLRHVFEAFGRSEQAESGLGLGLPLVKGFVELHGGSVRAESPGRGQGFTVTIELPLACDPRIAPAITSSVAERGRSRRVLLIEDNIDAAESLRTLLHLNGHEVAVAHDGLTGLELARRFEPEIVLCDLGLPNGMDGCAVARRIRSEPTLGAARLIAVSGFGLESDLQRAREAGFDLHLLKPVDPEVLQRLISVVPER